MIVDGSSIPQLLAWAHRRKQCVTVFDLETTTWFPRATWLGITEVALLTIHPDGLVDARSALVNPERRIPREVTELTGIRNEDVAGQPTWEQWALLLHDCAREHVMVGYNSSTFDCIVVTNQNARYAVPETAFRNSLDVMALPGVQGTLGEAAASHGITSDALHRAMADVWLAARLADKVAELHGLDVLDERIGRLATPGGGGYSPRSDRETELLTIYSETGALPDLDAFGEKHGIQRSTSESDAFRLIERGDLPPEVLEIPEIQEWLTQTLSGAISACWVETTQQRLRPLFEYLHVLQPPVSLDYTQLRLALRRWRSQAGHWVGADGPDAEAETRG